MIKKPSKKKKNFCKMPPPPGYTKIEWKLECRARNIEAWAERNPVKAKTMMAGVSIAAKGGKKIIKGSRPKIIALGKVIKGALIKTD